MPLVPLLSPESSADVMTTVALLEAHGIPYFVRGGGFGGLYPGVQITSYNARTILVPESALAEARTLLDELPDETDVGEEVETGAVACAPSERRGVLRVLVEFLLLGWFIPRRNEVMGR